MKKTALVLIARSKLKGHFVNFTYEISSCWVVHTVKTSLYIYVFCSSYGSFSGGFSFENIHFHKKSWNINWWLWIVQWKDVFFTVDILCCRRKKTRTARFGSSVSRWSDSIEDPGAMPGYEAVQARWPLSELLSPDLHKHPELTLYQNVIH